MKPARYYLLVNLKKQSALYRGLKDAKYKNRKLVEDIQNDFRQLCEMNHGKPEMAIIARQLGITSKVVFLSRSQCRPNKDEFLSK